MPAKKKAPGKKKASAKKNGREETSSVIGEPRMVDLLTTPPEEVEGDGTTTLIPEQHDVLKEVGHVGAGRASGELSRLTGSIVKVSQPKVEFFSMKEQPEKFFDCPDSEVVVVFSPVQGQARGEMLTLLYGNTPLALVDILLEKEIGTTKDLSDEDDQRRVTALCADLGNRYLAAVSQLLGLKLQRDEYHLVAADPKAFTTYLSMSILAGQDNAIFLKISTNFSTTHTDEDTGKQVPIRGDFIFLLELDSVIGMLKVVKDKLENMTL